VAWAEIIYFPPGIVSIVGSQSSGVLCYRNCVPPVPVCELFFEFHVLIPGRTRPRYLSPSLSRCGIPSENCQCPFMFSPRSAQRSFLADARCSLSRKNATLKPHCRQPPSRLVLCPPCTGRDGQWPLDFSFLPSWTRYHSDGATLCPISRFGLPDHTFAVRRSSGYFWIRNSSFSS